MNACPCGSGTTYDDCCGAYISGYKSPDTPEALMRSRYTAYTQLNMDYIAKTMKSPAADNFDATDAKAWAKKITWVQLEVIKTGVQGTHGSVEFIAHYIIDNKKDVLHEISQFRRDNGTWYYVEGTHSNKTKLSTVRNQKIGRNDRCPCGSNKKYKQCCGS